MADDYTRQSHNPKLDAAIMAAGSIEEIRELMKAEFERTGIAQRERDGSYTQLEQTHAPSQSAPASQPAPLLRRIINVGGRAFVISETSEERLDQMEKALQAVR
jgi:hypothetical protein